MGKLPCGGASSLFPTTRKNEQTFKNGAMHFSNIIPVLVKPIRILTPYVKIRSLVELYA